MIYATALNLIGLACDFNIRIQKLCDVVVLVVLLLLASSTCNNGTDTIHISKNALSLALYIVCTVICFY
jgi:hypothetical protein